MTAPHYVDCKCGHTKVHHELEGFGDQCTHAACTCLHYRPETAPEASVTRHQFARVAPTSQPAPQRPTEPSLPSSRDQRGPTLEQVLAAGKRSAFKRTVQLTEKIAMEIHDLRGRLTDERQAAVEAEQRNAQAEAARAELATIEARAAELKALLRGRTPPQHPGLCRPPAAESWGHLHVPDVRADVRPFPGSSCAPPHLARLQEVRVAA